MVLSYTALILLFTVLLLLPISQYGYQEGGLSALNALFLTVSAICVTGLAPVDIASTFSPFGLGVLVLAVQLGGIGIALLGSIMLYVRRSVGLSGRTLLAYSFSDDAVSDVGKVALRVIWATLIIELIGASYFVWHFFVVQEYLLMPALGHGIFFSISAFNNAGFSLFTGGSLESLRFDFSFLWMINLLIIFGVVGFNFIFYELNRMKRALGRYLSKGVDHLNRTQVTMNNSTLVLRSGYGSILLMVVLFFLFYAFEHPHSIYVLSTAQQYIESAFLSVDAKTAGFMSRDFTTLRFSTQGLFLLGMFIGGASGGTAGGIKLNTILVIFAGFRAFIQQRPLAKIGQMSISWEDVRRANILFISAILVVILATFALSITERVQEPFAIFWEVVSALGTVGTSLNYTSDLTVLGRIVIMSVMLIGRLGALTLFSFAQEREVKKEPSYPLGNVYIG
nr:potassium transporter TrkG [Entomospira culicis]